MERDLRARREDFHPGEKLGSLVVGESFEDSGRGLKIKINLFGFFGGLLCFGPLLTRVS